jgi:prolyl-tRNA synthetase
LDASVGVRLADADLFGIPYRVVVSAKTLAAGTLEVKNRITGEVTMMKEEELMKMVLK